MWNVEKHQETDVTVYFTIHDAFISSEKWVNGKILPQLVTYVSEICEFDSNKDPKMTFFQEHVYKLK